jgi:hypothetical protein
MQRLVPIEELLSQLGAKHSSTSAPHPVAAPVSVRASATATASAPVASSSPQKVVMTAGSLALASNPDPLPEPVATGPQLVATQPAPAAALDLHALQSACVAALAAVKGQQSASETIEDSAFSLSGDTVRIQTSLPETMLSVVLNADADRILNSMLRAASPGLKLRLLAGAPGPANASPKKPRVASVGSAAELAQKHPVVQQAMQLFSAEISNVIDLRSKD